MANKFNCDLLILYVQPLPRISFFYDGLSRVLHFQSFEEKPVRRLKELHDLSKPKLNEGLLLTSAIVEGPLHSALKDVIISEHIDLVIIPKGRRRVNNAIIKRLDIAKLTEQTGCPLLTVNRQFNANNLHNILVPLQKFLPIKKLTMATYMSIEMKGCIYLMGADQRVRELDKGILSRAFQLLNEFGKLNVRCALLHQDASAEVTLNYARDIKADLIVVNPDKESRLSGWWNKLMGNTLFNKSDIPIMTVCS